MIMVKKTNVSIVSIRENSFSINTQNLPASKDRVDILLGYAWGVDIVHSHLTMTMWVRLQEKGNSGVEKEDLVSLNFSYTVHIDDLPSFAKRQEQGSNTLDIPSAILNTIIRDTYATGRVLLSAKLAGTALEGFYLPFGGASTFIARHPG